MELSFYIFGLHALPPLWKKIGAWLLQPHPLDLLGKMNLSGGNQDVEQRQLHYLFPSRKILDVTGNVNDHLRFFRQR